VQPFVVRVVGRDLGLDLRVGDDPSGCGVDEEHRVRLEPAPSDDLGGRDGQHAALAGEDDPVVDGAPPPAGP
jgi:hypothetical protein